MNADTQALVEIARLVAIVAGLLIVGGIALGIVAAIKAPELAGKILLAAIQSGSFVRFTTVLVIVATVFALRFLDKVSAEATIATLSGIAGYILGNAKLVGSGGNPEALKRD
jgi:hypothetical protein